MTRNADATKIAMIRLAVPNFNWDLTRQWKARVKDAVEKHGGDPLYLTGILAVETDTVKEHINEALRNKR
jgi:hypothetical protein